MRMVWRRLAAIAEAHKIISSFAPVGVIMVLVRIFPPDQVQLWTILATMPIAVVFVVAYLPEHPGRDWFGTSLLVLAYSVIAIAAVAAMVRLFGPHMWYQHLVNVWLGLMFAALLARTWVLLHGQWHQRRHLGGWLRNRFRKDREGEALK